MIRANDPKHKDFIEEIDDGKDYIIKADKIPPGESLMCSDDQDMTIIKQTDGSIVLNKKAFSKNCFTK